MSEWIQGRLTLRGRVQGVGYRYFVLRTAREFEVAGLVRNLPSGEVEVIAEGKREEIERFFEEVKKGPASAHVSSFLEEWFPFSGLYHDFRVGY